MDNIEPIVDPIVEPVLEPTPTPVDAPISEEKVKEIQRKAFGHVFNLIDEKLAEAGYLKPVGVKTTEYILEVIASKNTTAPDTVQADPDSTSKIKALQESLRQKETELEQVKASTSVAKRDFYLDSTLSNLSIEVPSHLSDTEKSRYVERAKSTIKRELDITYDLKEVNGQFKVYEKDGSPVLDGTIEMDSIKLNDLLKRDFSEFFAKAVTPPAPVKGTGGEKPVVAASEGVNIPNTVKDATQLHFYLTRDKKYVLGDENYNKYIRVAQEQRPSWFK